MYLEHFWSACFGRTSPIMHHAPYLSFPVAAVPVSFVDGSIVVEKPPLRACGAAEASDIQAEQTERMRVG